MISFSLGLFAGLFLAIVKEHADRQKDVKAMQFIPAGRPDLIKTKVITKSWWEQIKEAMEPVVLIGLMVLLGWLVIQMVGV